ncbi:MAG TPA: phosphodiesterase [Candidatus Gallimonas intestinavium]|uniref:Phosphoesterase n=1 Tax=Candidatus Gallimonas intestinavium TaxID=2838603 RepID=A0A9D2JZ19_9FIRM|nr:phosphodiesterase [Candidatus Gallimonas intestinavium]
MKYMIASDIHGSAYFCRLLKERFEEEKADLLILLGDLLYHGARNALPKDYSTLATAEILNSMKDDLVCVRGNCDSEVDELVLEFPIGAEYCVLPCAGRRLFLTHGHKTPKHLKKGDVLFNGHFHVPAFEERETCTYVNCGSVSIPKENSPHSYLILEDGVLVWKDVETGNEYRRETL